MSFLCIPELTALSLSDGVVGQDDVTSLGEIDVQDLIGALGLASRRMAARAEDAWERRHDPLGLVEQGRYEITGEAFEDELFDYVIVGFDCPRFSGRRNGGLRGQAVDQSEKRVAQ